MSFVHHPKDLSHRALHSVLRAARIGCLILFQPAKILSGMLDIILMLDNKGGWGTTTVRIAITIAITITLDITTTITIISIITLVHYYIALLPHTIHTMPYHSHSTDHSLPL